MKKGLRFVSLLLSLLLSAGTLAACGGGNQEDSTKKNSPDTTETASGGMTDTESDASDTTDTQKTESNTEKTENNTEKTEIDTEEETVAYVAPDCTDQAVVDLANRLANGVNVYYPDSTRQSMVLENKNVSLEYSLSADKGQQVAALKNSKGQAFLENSMDVFLRTTAGDTYLASGSSFTASTNVRRFGYYYYEARVEGQDFMDNLTVTDELALPLKAISPKDMTTPEVTDGVMTFTTKGEDAHFTVTKSFRLADYNYLSITMKADYTSAAVTHMIYGQTESMKNFSQDKIVRFPFTGDGEYHEYRIPLSSFGSPQDKITNLRIDFDGVFKNTNYEIKEIKLLKVDTSKSPETLGLARTFHVYSDKLHQVAQVAALEKTENIAEIGFLVKLPKSDVKALVIKDKNGIHKSLDSVNQATIEFVGFDTEAGVVGFINPTGKHGGKMTLRLENGEYVLEHSRAPENGTVIPSVEKTKNANDFYIGQRVYTSDSHDLDAFIAEAVLERTPLTAKNVTVNDGSSFATFLGYDPLRGCYHVELNGSPNFNIPYYQSPNRHYIADLTFKGDGSDRSIYLMAATQYGYLESAVVLDEDKMLLPVPVEVTKNFSEASGGERNLFDKDDPLYSEAILPLAIGKNATQSYTVAHVYQNWGRYPLKQISSIQSITPYYHLSTGVTESNCITPYYVTSRSPYSDKNLNMLPDHRAASAPLWEEQPQHMLGGFHYFMQYTDAEGNFSAGELEKLTVGSYGPTYADVKMDYLSADGKIKVSYTHMEMPQTDENRTYYLMEYTVLEDVKIADFRHDFAFYSMRENGTGAVYTQVGYLDANNKSAVVDANKSSTPKTYVLGDESPYFSYFNAKNYTNDRGYVNLSFLVHSSSFIIGGKESKAPFILVDGKEELFLSLDLGEVTLKKGDKLILNAIIMPWGSEETVYDGSNGKAPDQNVRDVRANSILDPLKATAVADCTVENSVFLPKVRTTNGKSASFTLSGGENNVAVRVYGFDLLTVPTIYEKVGNEWVEYAVSSKATPDGEGYGHDYDGYTVYYDGDGTFSYAFVTDLEGDETRTFKVVADTAFEGWATDEPEDDKPANGVFLTPDELDAAAASSKGVGAHSVMTEGEDTFVRIFGNGSSGEAYLLPYTASSTRESGSFVFIKYRIPTTNKEGAGLFEFYLSTSNSSPQGADRVQCPKLTKDGEWHIAVMDISKTGHPTFKQDSDCRYYTRYLRLDIFNQTMSTNSYVDVAFFGMAPTLADVCALAKGLETVSLVEGGSETLIDTATGEPVNSGAGDTPDYSEVVFVDPASGYTVSKVQYASCLDMVNGMGEGGNGRLFNRGGNCVKGIDILEFPVETVNGGKVVFSGWTIAEGGVSKYVYSADGGKTWVEATLSNEQATLVDGTTAHLNAATDRIGGKKWTDAEKSVVNAKYQDVEGAGANANGLAADLSAYSGQTVSVIFAAVPASAPDTLCLIAYLPNVTVK